MKQRHIRHVLQSNIEKHVNEFNPLLEQNFKATIQIQNDCILQNYTDCTYLVKLDHRLICLFIAHIYVESQYNIKVICNIKNIIILAKFRGLHCFHRLFGYNTNFTVRHSFISHRNGFYRQETGQQCNVMQEELIILRLTRAKTFTITHKNDWRQFEGFVTSV